jgi:hypothetical protein
MEPRCPRLELTIKNITANTNTAITASPPITPPTIALTGAELEFDVEEVVDGGVEDEVGRVLEEGKEFGLVEADADCVVCVVFPVSVGVGYPKGYCVPVEMPFIPE